MTKSIFDFDASVDESQKLININEACVGAEVALVNLTGISGSISCHSRDNGGHANVAFLATRMAC